MLLHKRVCARTFKNDSVASENFELVHLSLRHLDNRIVVLFRVLDLQLVRGLLAVHNRSRIVLLRSIS